MKARKPALIVIDTIAMAFTGLEENDARSMGLEVAAARFLTKWGAAVPLIHHDTKDGMQGLPRGHSILNGALDMSLHLRRNDQGGAFRAVPRWSYRQGGIRAASPVAAAGQQDTRQSGRTRTKAGHVRSCPAGNRWAGHRTETDRGLRPVRLSGPHMHRTFRLQKER